MNAEPRILRTRAEDEIAALFAAERERLPGGAAAWRDDAYARFAKAGLPHRRVEAWKYTDLRALMRTVPPLAGAPAKLAAPDHLSGLQRARVAIVNGIYRPDLSDLADIEGVTVEPLDAVMLRDPTRIGRLFAGNPDAMVALNAALVQGGVVVTVAKDARPALPLEIAHLSMLDAPASIWSRDLVDVGVNAFVRIVETYAGPSGVAYQRHAATELSIANGAQVSWSRLQAEGSDALHIGSLAVRIGADAGFDHLVVSAGSAISRWQAFATIAGKGTRAGFFGANMLRGGEHGDLALVVNHAESNSASRELFKNVVDGEAEGAFQGRIVVERGAQKTDAKMMTQALLLSDTAEFAQKPELEIFADDVQCGHGATAGQIDEAMLFYLMARGIPRTEAERLLIEAFLDDPIDAIGDGGIATALKATVGAWLARRSAA